MSESTSAPSAPADTGADSAPASSPAPSSQEPISVSDAGRLLSRHRRNGQAAPTQAAPTDRPAPRDLAALAKTEAAAAPTPAPAAPPAAELSALDKALGVPGSPPPEKAAETPAPTGDAVEIEGKRYTTSELRDFILKGNDYTQKTQALADQGRQLAARAQQIEAQQQALATVLPYIQPELQKLAQTMAQPVARPDPALLETNPQQYLRERAAYEQAVEEQNRLSGLTSLQQQAQQRAMEQQVAVAHEALVKEFPFWADPAERFKVQQELITWATTKGGYTRDQLHNLTDPAVLKTMMKARTYDKWMDDTRTSAPVQRVGAPVRGAPPPAPQSERVTQAEQAFEGKADVRNATALLAARRARQ